MLPKANPSPGPAEIPGSPGIGVKTAYGVGGMVLAAKDAAYGYFVPFFYTQVAGLSGSLVGAAALIGQLSDAVTDPICGTLSDNSRSRWGRRRPWMLASALPLGACFLLLFDPPSGTEPWILFLWLAGVSVALRTCLTSFVIPHAALGAELSTDYETRSLVVSYRTAFYLSAGVLMPWLGLTFLFPRGEGATDGRLLASNYVVYGVLSAVVAVLAAVLSTVSTRGQGTGAALAAPRRRLRLRDPLLDLRNALRNRNFVWIFAALVLVGTSLGVHATFAFYANTYFWEFSSRQIGWLSLVSVAPTLLGFLLIRPLSRRFEKRTLYAAALTLMAVNSLWWIPGRLLGWLPANGTAALFALALVHQFLVLSAIFLWSTVAPSIVADIADEEALATGERREGVFFGAVGFASKIPTGLGQLAAGILIDVVDLPPGAAPGAVPGNVLFMLGVVAGPLVGASFLAPLFFVSRLSLDRRRYGEIRRLLDRRASDGETPPEHQPAPVDPSPLHPQPGRRRWLRGGREVPAAPRRDLDAD